MNAQQQREALENALNSFGLTNLTVYPKLSQDKREKTPKFFLNNGFIGEFAKNRIQTIISKLDPDEKKSKKDINRDLIWDEIQIIGEPFLKEKLEEMYYTEFDKTKRINELRAELNRLEND